MRYRTLGNSNLEVSVVGLGTWAMGADFFGAVDDSESVRAIHAALDSGINLIDTAPAYGAGHAEEVVGRALKEAGHPENVIVATKVGILRTEGEFRRNLKPESVRKEIHDSLRRLNVDCVDLYQIHWPDPDTPLDDTLAELRKIHDAGKFRHLGVSNFSGEQIDQCRAVLPVVSAQPHYSLLQRDAEADVIPYCYRNNIGLLGYGTYAGGILTGKFREPPQFEEGDHRAAFYQFFEEPVWTQVQKLLDVLREIASHRNVEVAEVSRNWAIRENGGVTTALVGAKNERQAASNATGTDWQLTSEELDRIDRAGETLRDARKS